MAYPPFSEAMVLKQDPKFPGVRVILASGQVPALPVKMLHSGPADGTSVSHKGLPRPGSWGLVAFPGGDERSGVWLGSVYLSQQDAYASETDPNLALDAHFSGAYEMLDGQGRWTKYFPDGTFIQVSDSTAKPTLSRHTIDQTQTRNLTAFPDTQRVSSTPSARHFVINHISGTVYHIDTSGNLSITGTGSAGLTVTFGGKTLTLDSSGHLTFNGTQVTLPNLPTSSTGPSGSLYRTGNQVNIV